MLRLMAALCLVCQQIAFIQPARAQDYTQEFAAALGEVYQLLKSNRLGEAESAALRAILMAEQRFGSAHAETARALGTLAFVYEKLERYRDAELLYQRSLPMLEKSLGSVHTNVATMVIGLAIVLKAQGRCQEAEPLFQRDLAISEKLAAPPRTLANTLIAFAECQTALGQLSEAERSLRRSLDLFEKSVGASSVDYGQALGQLGLLYLSSDRIEEAANTLLRAHTILEKAAGRDSIATAAALHNIGLVLMRGGNFDRAEQALFQSLKILQSKVPPHDLRISTGMRNISGLYIEQRKFDKALPMLRTLLNFHELRRGSTTHPDLVFDLNQIAVAYSGLGMSAEAEQALQRALRIVELNYGPNHPHAVTVFGNMSATYADRRDWVKAVAHLESAARIIVARTRQGTFDAGLRAYGRDNELLSNRNLLNGLVHAYFQLAQVQKHRNTELARTAFNVAQWASHSEAASSIALASARHVRASAALADMVRERQDLAAEWQSRNRQLANFLSRIEPAANDTAAVKDRIAKVESRLAAIDRQLHIQFADYAVYAYPEPVPLQEVQGLLNHDEALVFLVHVNPSRVLTTENAYAWVITKTNSRWVRNDLGSIPLRDRIDILRCGLDASEMIEDPANARQTGRRKRCLALLNSDQQSPLPYDLGVAHSVFEILFGGAKDLVRQKHILLVPSTATQGLAFSALVTERPSSARPREVANYRDAKWLALDNAITVLPSVASLRALRANRQQQAPAPEAYLGVGDPDLVGNSECAPSPVFSECPGRERGRLASAASRVNRRPLFALGWRRGGFANISLLREQCPLPETAFELSCVAQALAGGSGNVLTRGQATEKLLRSMPLERYRVVHFATHGVLAGEAKDLLSGDTLPGLLLTPPAIATAEDDGYLTSSEIAQLRLNANWVILSACNTAAPEKDGGNALSGLASAFLYAGARALLVSQWYVNSEASVKLITRTFAAMAETQGIGRAEAFRRAMTKSILDDAPYAAHPAYWAPFVVVGEGAR